MDTIEVFDTTLRDGEQAPGMSMAPDAKLRMARQLVRLGVDVIEAGFPASSESDAVAVHAIARELGSDVTVAALARATIGDIDAAARTLEPAARRRIHTFAPVSDLHIQVKLERSRAEVYDAAMAAVRHARTYTDDVQFGMEDASRADTTFLCDIIEGAISEGARTVALADTVGYMMPWEFGALIRTVIERVPNIHQALVGVHCHDDLGLGVANTLAGVSAGARHIECTINGIGERAGNAALEEVIMAFHTRMTEFELSFGVRTPELYGTSKLLEQIVGVPVQPNKAVVGSNAFAHEAGIHQHGVLVNPLTYEIMTPALVGQPASRLVMGRHSGRHALRVVLEQQGLRLDEDEVDHVFAAFKAQAPERGSIPVEKLCEMARRCQVTAERLAPPAHASLGSSAG